MKTFLKNFSIQFFILLSFGVSYATWNTIVNDGDVLTAAQWNELVTQIEQIESQIGDIPPGAVIAFDLASCPAGWIPANGQNGAVDLRGEFVRGLDGGRGVDAGRVLRSSQADETESHTHGDGTLGGTANSAGAHTHSIQVGATIGDDEPAKAHLNTRQFTQNIQSSSAGTHTHTLNITGSTAATGGSETRPRNVALLYCVKN